MIKYAVFFSVSIAVLFSGFNNALAESKSSVKKEINFKGKKVLYVTKLLNGALAESDSISVNKIKDMGLNVACISSKTATADSAAGFDVIFISEMNSSNDIADKYKNTEKPLILAEHYVADDMGWTGSKQNVDFGQMSGIKQVKIVNQSHPVSIGLNGLVDIYTESESTIVGFTKQPKGDVTIIATAPNNDSLALIYAYEKNSKDMNGSKIPGRRITSYLFASSEKYHTEAGWNLLKASLAWALGL